MSTCQKDPTKRKVSLWTYSKSKAKAWQGSLLVGQVDSGDRDKRLNPWPCPLCSGLGWGWSGWGLCQPSQGYHRHSGWGSHSWGQTPGALWVPLLWSSSQLPSVGSAGSHQAPPRTMKSSCPTTCPLDSLPPAAARQPRDPPPLQPPVTWILLLSWMEDSLGCSGKSKECPREVPGNTLVELCPAASRMSQGWACPGVEASGDNYGPGGHAGGRKLAVVSPWHRSLFQRGWERPVHMLVHSLHPCALWGPKTRRGKAAPWES